MPARVSVKAGVNILNFGKHATPETLRLWAVRAESLGYHLAMISDHVAITPDVQAQYPAPFYDPFLTLAWLAGQTHRIELGTTVAILPYRHPLQTARLAANLDQLSGGRFILGVGVGWAKEEFEALGVPFEKRGAITNEYLEVIRACLGNELVSYSGKHVSFRFVRTKPRPVEHRRLPVWVGGSSDAALERAVKFGDAWHPIQKRLDWLKGTGLPRLREIAGKHEKPAPDFCPRINLQLSDAKLDDETRLPGQGTLDQVRADLEALAAMGAKYVLLDTYAGKPLGMPKPEADWAQLEALATSVLDLARETLR